MVYGLDGDTQMYDPGAARGHVIAAPIASGPGEGAPLAGVVTLLLDGRSRAAMQTTLALVEVLAGYAHHHAAQRALRRVQASSASLDLAARLIAAVNQTADFKGATIQLVNDLARQLGLDRAALGWTYGAGSVHPEGEGPTGIRCVALSDTEMLDRRMAMVQRLEAAMEECLDQQQAVLLPAPSPEADPVLAQAVTHAHRELTSRDAGLKVASVPLRVGDARGERVVGVVLLEAGAGARLDAGLVELVQATMDLVAPVLSVKHSDARPLPRRLRDAGVRAGAWLVGPKHTAWKLVGLTAMLGLLFVTFYPATYRVGATMELLPRERRTISMPFDGTLGALSPGAEAGAKVTKGQVLAEVDTRELTLALLEARSQVVQYEKQADEALKKGEMAEVVQVRARAEQARARTDLLRSQLERSRLTAPIDGTIIAGDLKGKVGSAVRVGERLFEVAGTDDLEVVAMVDDRDIAYIREGQTGEVSPKAAPDLAVAFVVERIVPASQAKEGQNVFEVRGRLTEPLPAGLLPGVQGQARFNTQRRSLAWIASRRIVDQARVWLWW
jgi:biotin carboxyl carrier protein